MRRRPTRSTRTDTLLPYTTLCRSRQIQGTAIDLDVLGACADRYGVSMTSAILKWLELTPQRAVLVMSQNGIVQWARSEAHTSELQSLMRISYAVLCLKKKYHQTPPKQIQNSRSEEHIVTTYC